MADLYNDGSALKIKLQDIHEEVKTYAEKLNEFFSSKKNSNVALDMSSRLTWKVAASIIPMMPPGIKICCPLCLLDCKPKSIMAHLKTHKVCIQCLIRECQCEVGENTHTSTISNHHVVDETMNYNGSGYFGPNNTQFFEYAQYSSNDNMAVPYTFPSDQFGGYAGTLAAQGTQSGDGDKRMEEDENFD